MIGPWPLYSPLELAGWGIGLLWCAFAVWWMHRTERETP